jgi:alpha-tubulin suppressor-like RCC1 family protein
VDQPNPRPVLLITDAVQITDHCARRVGNTVVCWGPNDWGQLGDGSMTPGLQPVTVHNLSDATDLESFDDQACALRQTGETVCWGRNDQGQLGINVMDVGWVMRDPTTVMNLPDALYLALGRRHSCAVQASGQVVCWGLNDEYQVSYTPGVTNHLVPIAVEGL